MIPKPMTAGEIRLRRYEILREGRRKSSPELVSWCDQLLRTKPELLAPLPRPHASAAPEPFLIAPNPAEGCAPRRAAPQPRRSKFNANHNEGRHDAMDSTWGKVTDSSEGRLNWDEVGAGGVVEGVLKGLTATVGKGTDLEIEIEGRGAVTAPAGAVLVRRLSRIPVGTAIAIKHNGMREPARPDGRPWRDFDVFVPPGTVLLPPKASTVAASGTNGTEEVPF